MHPTPPWQVFAARAKYSKTTHSKNTRRMVGSPKKMEWRKSCTARSNIWKQTWFSKFWTFYFLPWFQKENLLVCDCPRFATISEDFEFDWVRFAFLLLHEQPVLDEYDLYSANKQRTSRDKLTRGFKFPKIEQLQLEDDLKSLTEDHGLYLSQYEHRRWTCIFSRGVP